MAENIFIEFSPESIDYSSSGFPTLKLPTRSRQSHAEKLKNDLSQIWEKVEQEKLRRAAIQLPVKDGTYLEFIGEPGFPLTIRSLENKNTGIRLVNVRRYKEEDEEVKELVKATVFVPNGKEQYFLERIIAYQKENTPKGRPQNQNLIETISGIKRAVLESFWIGDERYIPQDTPAWCEIWLYDDNNENALNGIEKEFRGTLKELGIESRKETIKFPEVQVILLKVNYNDLVELLVRNENIMEIRRATEVTTFFTELDHKEQIKWAKELLSRTEVQDSNVVVSILDSGLNNGNILLSNLVSDSDIHSYFGDPGNDNSGHGTKMAGVTLYGDLKSAIETFDKVNIPYALESVKILPDIGENEPELYGYITVNSISNLYIKDEHKEKHRIVCMAISTENYAILDGRPSSWSAAIDNTTAGSVDEIPKLFLVSAGNIRELRQLVEYPNINLVESIEDPGQSWNAITVGAYTNLDTLDNANYTPVASKGELSPFSRTSMIYNKSWPIKPEIVLEGGNVAQDSFGAYEDENLSLLTTHHDPTTAVFTHINATSAATAKASRMAAIIQSEYPEAWPETVRALLVHSAEWTDEMIHQFLKGTNKGDYRALLRTCGYGVPNLTRAIETINNRVNLIIQSELQPYEKGKNGYKMKDMHLHELPWPKELLQEIFTEEVEMRVTLSYFIEPGPGEKGWQDKYRYASAGLRFDLNGSNSKEEFKRRINIAARDDKEEITAENSVKWILGPENRNVGSIHSDIWKGAAADLAHSNYIGVYPIVGWWRERSHLGKWNNRLRYSLVVSLSTPNADVDLLTPIQNEIQTRVATEIRTEIET